MKNHIVIALIAGTYYMTNLKAESVSAAEHAILDKGICGRHEYTVDACMAFDEKTIKTDAFVGCATSSIAISCNDLVEIIERRNNLIRARDAAEDRVHEIEKQMKALAAEMKDLKELLSK